MPSIRVGRRHRDYAKISEKYEKIAQGKNGEVFMGFDILKYQVAVMLQNNWQKMKTAKVTRKARMTNFKSLMNRQAMDNFSRAIVNEASNKSAANHEAAVFNRILAEYHQNKKNSTGRIIHKSEKFGKTMKKQFGSRKEDPSLSQLPLPAYLDKYSDIFRNPRLASSGQTSLRASQIGDEGPTAKNSPNIPDNLQKTPDFPVNTRTSNVDSTYRSGRGKLPRSSLWPTSSR